MIVSENKPKVCQSTAPRALVCTGQVLSIVLFFLKRCASKLLCGTSYFVVPMEYRPAYVYTTAADPYSMYYVSLVDNAHCFILKVRIFVANR